MATRKLPLNDVPAVQKAMYVARPARRFCRCRASLCRATTAWTPSRSLSRCVSAHAPHLQ